MMGLECVELNRSIPSPPGTSKLSERTKVERGITSVISVTKGGSTKCLELGECGRLT